MNVTLTCPLGSTCEEVRDNTLHRCRWYTQVQGQHPTTGEVIDQWDCAISWLPVLTLETARTNRGQTAALESFRNEVAEQGRLANAIQLKALTGGKG